MSKLPTPEETRRRTATLVDDKWVKYAIFHLSESIRKASPGQVRTWLELIPRRHHRDDIAKVIKHFESAGYKAYKSAGGNGTLVVEW